jgi:hypothetical protein
MDGGKVLKIISHHPRLLDSVIVELLEVGYEKETEFVLLEHIAAIEAQEENASERFGGPLFLLSSATMKRETQHQPLLIPFATPCQHWYADTINKRNTHHGQPPTQLTCSSPLSRLPRPEQSTPWSGRPPRWQTQQWGNTSGTEASNRHSNQKNTEHFAHYLLTIMPTSTFQYIAGYSKEWQL